MTAPPVHPRRPPPRLADTLAGWLAWVAARAHPHTGTSSKSLSPTPHYCSAGGIPHKGATLGARGPRNQRVQRTRYYTIHTVRQMPTTCQSLRGASTSPIWARLAPGRTAKPHSRQHPHGISSPQHQVAHALAAAPAHKEAPHCLPIEKVDAPRRGRTRRGMGRHTRRPMPKAPRGHLAGCAHGLQRVRTRHQAAAGTWPGLDPVFLVAMSCDQSVHTDVLASKSK